MLLMVQPFISQQCSNACMYTLCSRGNNVHAGLKNAMLWLPNAMTEAENVDKCCVSTASKFTCVTILLQCVCVLTV